MGHACLLLAVACSPLADGWVTLPSDYEKWEGRKWAWSISDDPLSNEGLSGGIAFAVDPNFCAKMRPVFREDRPGDGSINFYEYITCEEINDALARAMSTWALNHPYIDFYNVTDECIAQGKGRKCTQAEVYIDAREPAADSDLVGIAAYVIHNPSWRDYNGTDQWESGIRHPNGDEHEEDWKIKFATVTFHNHLCWYLDNTFCSQFRRYHSNTGDIYLLGRVVIWSTWAVAFVYLLFHVCRTGYLMAHNGLGPGFRRGVQLSSEWTLPNYVFLFLILSPPIFWTKIFVPCVECYDFEGTAAHEIGHVLGFTHPDVYPQYNRVAERPFSPQACCARSSYPEGDGGEFSWMDKLSCGEGGSGTTKGAVRFDSTDPGINETLMYHLTTFKSRVCLTTNDLAGLLFHYPVCRDELIHTGEPVCVKSRRNIGYLRLLEAVGPPFFIASIMLFTSIHIARLYSRREASRNRWNLAGRVAAGRARAKEGERRRLSFFPGFGRRRSGGGAQGREHRSGHHADRSSGSAGHLSGSSSTGSFARSPEMAADAAAAGGTSSALHDWKAYREHLGAKSKTEIPPGVVIPPVPLRSLSKGGDPALPKEKQPHCSHREQALGGVQQPTDGLAVVPAPQSRIQAPAAEAGDRGAIPSARSGRGALADWRDYKATRLQGAEAGAGGASGQSCPSMRSPAGFRLSTGGPGAGPPRTVSHAAPPPPPGAGAPAAQSLARQRATSSSSAARSPPEQPAASGPRVGPSDPTPPPPGDIVGWVPDVGADDDMYA